MPRLLVVSTSTRPVSTGRPLAAWIGGAAAEHGGFEVVPVDLAEINLPLLDEPAAPASGEPYTHQHTKDWSALIESGDAVLFVLTMYNGAFAAPLKNAVDYLYREWQGKPVGLVSYTAGPSGGVPAAEGIADVLTRIGARVAESRASVPSIYGHLGDEGFTAPEGFADRLTEVLDELAKLATEQPVSS
ncbi:NADPH-dependent FMN reductase [Streptomyces sp. NPDC089799]|uniref:NADPH-dependent FMN reductase n=1 Tax=Streptomyces sp. NPDC089799 TaxID=3155066 RepID=UPI00342B3CC1